MAKGSAKSHDHAFFRISLIRMITMIYREYKGKRVNRERVKDKIIVCGSTLLMKETTSTCVSKHSII